MFMPVSPLVSRSNGPSFSQSVKWSVGRSVRPSVIESGSWSVLHPVSRSVSQTYSQTDTDRQTVSPSDNRSVGQIIKLSSFVPGFQNFKAKQENLINIARVRDKTSNQFGRLLLKFGGWNL